MSKILVIDNDPKICELLNVHLNEIGHKVITTASGKVGIEYIESFLPDVVICDLNLPDDSGLRILEIAKSFDSNIQVILITAYYDISSIIKAMQKGSFDFLQKPLDIEQLKLKISRALEIQSISNHLETYKLQETEEFKLENSLVGKTPIMREIAKNIGQLSLNRVSILIQGETGTGKELIAKIIHYIGISKDQPFVAVNCSALSENLLESELFGHVRGAFTGAIKEKRGKFELANEGTIFLDEISELSPQLQVKLLRVLQEREFEKVGGEYTIKMKARILAASNKDLDTLVRNGKFREDLFYRLKVFTINLPPLRDRKADIPIIVTHCLRKINKELHKKVQKIPIEVMEFLQEYEWPGNVRELENILYQAVVLSNSDVLLKENLILKKNNNEINESPAVSLEEMEKRHIIKILDMFDGDKQKALKILGISKPTLYSKLKKYNI